METVRAAATLILHARSVADHGNPNAKSDAMVAVQMAMMAVSGAYANVEINIDSVGDADYAAALRKEAKELMMNCGALLGPISEALGWKGHEPPRS